VKLFDRDLLHTDNHKRLIVGAFSSWMDFFEGRTSSPPTPSLPWMAHPKIPLTLSELQMLRILATIGLPGSTGDEPLTLPLRQIFDDLVGEWNKQRNIPSAEAIERTTRQLQATLRTLRTLEAGSDPSLHHDCAMLVALSKKLQSRELQYKSARATHKRQQKCADRSIQLEFIRGPLADAYRHLTNGRLAGRHRHGSRPAGPFVRFVVAFFSELGEPVSSYQVEDALRNRTRRK
jgi:hypothetical protein